MWCALPLMGNSDQLCNSAEMNLSENGAGKEVMLYVLY